MFRSSKFKVGTGVTRSMFTVAMVAAAFVANTEVVVGRRNASGLSVWRGGWYPSPSQGIRG